MPTTIRADEIPVTSAELGVEIARAQRLALLRQLEDLTPEQWTAATECTRWTVRDIVAHIAGELEYTRNPFAFAGFVVTWRRRFPELEFLDGTNEAAVDARRDWPVERLVEEFRRDIPRAVPPRWARRLPIGGSGGLPRGATFAYLVDHILPRDTWMHRRDIGRALGQSVEPDAGDAQVVTQVICDLAQGWTGPPVVLRLTGPGGGSFALGPSGAAPMVEVDVVDFLLHLSGRSLDTDLFEGVAEPLRGALTGARVLF